MEFNNPQVFAGVISSTLFITSNLPMLIKAFKTKDLKSYSLGYLGLSNLGNIVHWVYVSSIPFGPIWFLHGFYTLVAALMLFWYFCYELAGRSKILSTQLEGAWKCICGCAGEYIRRFSLDGYKQIGIDMGYCSTF